MSIDNYDLGIRSVTTLRGADGELKTVDTNEWVRDNYRINLQDAPSDGAIEPLTEVSVEKKPRKPRRKSVASEKPKQVGQELVEEAHQKDLKKRGLK